MTTDEIRPHDFKPGHSGNACIQMVMRDGYGDACGLPAQHPLHGINEWQRPGRTGRPKKETKP